MQNVTNTKKLISKNENKLKDKKLQKSVRKKALNCKNETWLRLVKNFSKSTVKG